MDWIFFASVDPTRGHPRACDSVARIPIINNHIEGVPVFVCTRVRPGGWVTAPSRNVGIIERLLLRVRAGRARYSWLGAGPIRKRDNPFRPGPQRLS